MDTEKQTLRPGFSRRRRFKDLGSIYPHLLEQYDLVEPHDFVEPYEVRDEPTEAKSRRGGERELFKIIRPDGSNLMTLVAMKGIATGS